MSAAPTLPGRRVVGLAALLTMALLVGLDLALGEAPDPFTAPPPLALGSGVAPSGAHCSAR